MDVRPSRQLRFPPFRLDPDNASLWRGTTEVRLTPKAFAVLHCLVERHGQLVTKDALLERVWPGTVVGDAVLKVCVREIRKAIGDRVGAPRFVATVHRRGYRFIADVTDVDPRPERDEASGRSGIDAAGRSRASYRGPAYFVGREPVLDRLQTGLEAAWRGLRQIVFVTGEPGIGKTGVVEAFLERVAARHARLDRARSVRRDVRNARAVSARARGARPALSGERGRLAGHPPTPARAHLARADAVAPRSAVDRDALQQELLGATRERMLREMAEALEALTVEAPLVMVLEDLHWSDAATVDLVSLLARRTQPARLLLIGTYRPGDVHRPPAPSRGRQARAAGGGTMPGAVARAAR